MVNPDGVLRLDRLGEGRSKRRPPEPGEVERDHPPGRRHMRPRSMPAIPSSRPSCRPRRRPRRRAVRGLLPPVSTAPCFSIRKPAERIYTLDDYVADGS